MLNIISRSNIPLALQLQAPSDAAAPSYNMQAIHLLQCPLLVSGPFDGYPQTTAGDCQDATAISIAAEFDQSCGEARFSMALD